MFRLPQPAAAQLEQALLEIPGISGLHSGRFGEVALLYANSRIPGIRIDDDCLEVHVIAEFGVDYQELANSVREVVHAQDEVPGHVQVDVFIADLVESE
ncbi:MAG: Asp23/Gls24 family envelope stress response protein [Corynebacterium sp.]|nr:Asp23/Gls24 family envelope stress response protein [Corynebacterium sp.]